jgi:hypothetical protein
MTHSRLDVGIREAIHNIFAGQRDVHLPVTNKKTWWTQWNQYSEFKHMDAIRHPVLHIMKPTVWRSARAISSNSRAPVQQNDVRKGYSVSHVRNSIKYSDITITFLAILSTTSRIPVLLLFGIRDDIAQPRPTVLQNYETVVFISKIYNTCNTQNQCISLHSLVSAKELVCYE